MPRISEVTAESASSAQRDVLAEDVSLYGDVLHTTRIYAHAPEVIAPLRALHGALAGAGMDDGLVSLARLRVAQINGCPF